jgi:hypothetical protein
MTKRERWIKYLTEHFRYNTMHSWNRSTSYARNVKLHKLSMDAQTRDRAYELLDVSGAFGEVNALIEAFERKHDWTWQVGFNGRSGGYLVLYQGGRKESDYKTRCSACGKLTWYEIEQSCHMDGCEGTLEILEEPVYQTFTYPGKGTDDDADFSEWTDDDLRERVTLVRDFDRLCDACIRSFIHFAKTYAVEEQEILVPKTVKVAVKIKS